MVNFRPEIPLEDISIAIQLRETSYEKLEQLLGPTSNLLLDSLRLDEDREI